MTSRNALKYRIEGMDCASCASKIENALHRLPGVSDISVNFGQASMSLQVDEGQTRRATIEECIRALGFEATADTAGAGGTRRSPVSAAPRWWRQPRGRLVIGTGVLLAVSFLISQLAPAWSSWLYTAAALLGLIPIVRRAVAGATMGTPFSIETLMSIAAVGAIIIGAAPEAAVVVFLFATGELLEGIAASRARAGIKALMELVPRTAKRMSGSTAETVPVEDLVPGDLVMVRPGDRVPSDGEVREGESDVNEAPVTGESVPVAKQPGSPVFAGSINVDGELKVIITRAAADNTISRIIRAVEEAQEQKAPLARFIDDFSRWYTPAAIALALVVVIAPPLLLGADWSTWIYRGLAVLLVACPCALVISTPAAIASGLASGARRGLLVKGGAALEVLGKVKTVAFDKTGTLTRGKPQVTDVVPFSGSADELVAKAAAVERGSSHPLGVGILAAAAARAIEIPRTVGGSAATRGKAVTARLPSGFVSVGSPRYAAEQVELDSEAKRHIEAMEREGKTVVAVLEAKRLLGLIALRDEPRDDAREGLDRLRALGVETVMLTGDNARTAAAIAGALGLKARADLLPDDKLKAIAEYKSSGPIAMVGDGINDAPALAAASVGIAMGGGTDVALETADAALLKERVTGVAELITLSRATVANIWQNVTLALGLKGVFLITTLFGETPLWMAILADTGATVLVTANALRLLRLKKQ